MKRDIIILRPDDLVPGLRELNDKLEPIGLAIAVEVETDVDEGAPFEWVGIRIVHFGDPDVDGFHFSGESKRLE